jgi:hypothetical protein
VVSVVPGSRALRILNLVFFFAVASSIVHYTDNYLAFDRFPQEGAPGPEITRDSVWIAWLAFTAFGVAGYLFYRRGQIALASALLAVYSVSGLIGIGHWTADGASQLAWWRHAHVATDVLAGLAVFTFAVWSGRQASRRPARPSPRLGG